MKKTSPSPNPGGPPNFSELYLKVISDEKQSPLNTLAKVPVPCEVFNREGSTYIKELKLPYGFLHFLALI